MDVMESTTHRPEGFEVGDYLCSSWGYDQTNATFYKVTRRTPKMVTLLEVHGRPVTREDGTVIGLAPSDSPVLEHQACGFDSYEHSFYQHREQATELPCFVPITSRHKVQTYSGGAYVKITSYASARPWNGTPAFDTLATGGAGH